MRRYTLLLLLCTPLTLAHALDTDVPFVTTPLSVTEAMLKIANVQKGDFVIDLGSGDGRIVILAAKQFAARGLGVEIDPTLVAKSVVNAKERIMRRAGWCGAVWWGSESARRAS